MSKKKKSTKKPSDQEVIVEIDVDADTSANTDVEPDYDAAEEVIYEGSEEPQIALSDYNALEAKYADLQDQLLRVTAEYENFRRRTRKEKQALYDDASCQVVKAFLPVLDNFERALTTAKNLETDESKQLLAGVELIYKQAQNALSELQVTETDGKGTVFDPEQHVAVMHVEDEELADNVVKEVLEKGYKLKDKVIRHSTVIVAN